jgi:hypothetical protein
MNKEKKERKKFRDTKIGQFLKEKAPDILDKVADILPDKGALGIVKNIIDKDEKLSAEDTAEAMKLIEMEYQFETEITKRWESDMNSDNWLSKNSRPLVLLSAVGFLYIFIICDSVGWNFNIKESWISLYEVVLVTTIGAYFGMRSWEKIRSKK